MADLLGDPEGIAALQQDLLSWYRSCKRDMVWRDSDDPYRIWISEIMLQQTRVDQMDGHFRRFVAAFPTVDALAAAAEEEVLKQWEGLGYYARARNLHKAAKQIVADGGAIPDTYEALLALPGVGQYTAAAVSSIAFDRDHPVLDGNVTRVLCRLLRVEEDPRKSAVKAQLIAAGEKLLARGQAGDFNQAMMELGARVCTPRAPHCDTCPLAAWCRARAEVDDPSILPIKTPKKKKPHFQVAAGVIWRGDQVLIAQRPSEGLLGGMWEFPGGKQEEGESLEACLLREIDEELGIEIAVEEFLVRVEHAFSHFSISLHAFKARYVGGRPRALAVADWRWVKLAELDDFAFGRADRHVIDHLKQDAVQMGLFGGG